MTLAVAVADRDVDDLCDTSTIVAFPVSGSVWVSCLEPADDDEDDSGMTPTLPEAVVEEENDSGVDTGDPKTRSMSALISSLADIEV